MALELYRPKQKEIDDALLLASSDFNYIQLQYHGNTSIPLGLQDRSWIGSQGPSNGISLVTDNAPQVRFTKQGVYKVIIQYRIEINTWVKWGLRGDTSGDIKGESVWAGGAVGEDPQTFTFLVEISNINEDYKFFSVTSSSGNIINPVPHASNIGQTDVTIVAVIEEVKSL